MKRGKLFTFNGTRKTLAEWAKHPRCNVSYNTLRKRILIGWDFAEAFTRGVDLESKMRFGGGDESIVNPQTIFEAVRQSGTTGIETDWEPTKDDQEPTEHCPGSEAKIRILRKRVERGERLFHEQDRHIFAGHWWEY